MYYISRIRKLIEQSDYLELKQRSLLYQSHVIKTLIFPLRRLMRYGRLTCVKAVSRHTGIGSNPLTICSVEAWTVRLQASLILLANINDFQKGLDQFEQYHKCIKMK